MPLAMISQALATSDSMPRSRARLLPVAQGEQAADGLPSREEVGEGVEGAVAAARDDHGDAALDGLAALAHQILDPLEAGGLLDLDAVPLQFLLGEVEPLLAPARLDVHQDDGLGGRLDVLGGGDLGGVAVLEGGRFDPVGQGGALVEVGQQE